ncbi:MAG: four-carbon acid sugar kinase family protein [Burkholderiales bacterium]|nr:four-carbon acid sugar kinase family protein [Burkholderiales bacterium]
MLRLAWYGDDFTGASDTLATVASAGLRTLLFARVPTAAQLARAGELDALGIAGTARALAPAAMRAELAPVAAWFEALGAPVTHYKCCSTFDSAPAVGNLAVGLQALRAAAHQHWVPVVGGQPSLGRFCAFATLFASAAAGGDVLRIDRHPTMSRHPVTPMHEADLRRHLAAQGLADMAHIDLRLLDAADDLALDAALDAALGADLGAAVDSAVDSAVDATADAARGSAADATPAAPAMAATLADAPPRRGGRELPRAVLFDTTRHEHLARIGRLLWRRAQRRPLLALGASSVAQALIAQWRAEGLASPPEVHVAPAAGPVFVLAGSLSPVSAAQVAHAAPHFETVELHVPSLLAGGQPADASAARCVALLRQGRPVLARTSAPAGEPQPPIDVAMACGRLLARVLEGAPHVRRIGVAGGDTSSFALRALDPWALRWAGTLAPGVALLRLCADQPRLDGLELILKGGQMGPPDVFERLLAGPA